MDGDAELFPAWLLRQDLADLRLVADEDDLTMVFLGGAHRTENDLERCIIAAHGINCNLHARIPPHSSPHETMMNFARNTS